jgi:hypothetical protein
MIKSNDTCRQMMDAVRRVEVFFVPYIFRKMGISTVTF